ncbi:MAG: peptidylprolyl isomerase [Schleiferiaceae bacterium]|nr:peptidylprolyl isomerase [Schleiferiaceae bacterium]
MRKRTLRYFNLSLFLLPVMVFAQPKQRLMVDGIAAVVGNEVILISDVQLQYEATLKQSYSQQELDECIVFSEMLFQKLLLHQAEIDSISVSDAEVEGQLDARFDHLSAQLGGEKAVERYYEKSMYEMREEMRPLMKNQITAEKMRNTIIQDVSITPGEVQSYFDKVPSDSLPLMNLEVEIAQIVKYPEISREAELEAINRLKELKEKIETGTSFSSMAIFYSEDPGSSKEGGVYKGIKRGQFVPEFEAVAFNLKKGEISDPFKTEYGYHIVQLMDKKGQELDLRHILIKPKFKNEDLNNAKGFLDSLRVSINSGYMTFEEAAREFSEDDETKYNGGVMVNFQTGDTRWDVNNLDRQLFSNINDLNQGEVSKAVLWRKQDGSEAFRLLMLRKRSEPHKVNMRDDYQFIKTVAQQEKQKRVMDEWIEQRIEESYIKINPGLFDCELNEVWQALMAEN